MKDNKALAEASKQEEYIRRIKSLNDEYFKETGKHKKMLTVTFGCQMNAHDSEKLNGMLLKMGYVRAQGESDADFIIYNTCCVRENAENKVYGNLGFLKHEKKARPDLKIALCGCMMQQPTVIETIRKKYKHVDIVFGTFNIYKLPELMYRNIESGSPIFDIWKEHELIMEDLPAVRKKSFKASVNIMFGCNNFCTYCIVPYVRGRERSRQPEDIIKEIKELVKNGAKEIMLLGQNVNSYGKGLQEEISFARLLRMVNDIEGVERIRFMTSHPKDLSDELIYAMRDCEKVCKHLHLPFQAGNNDILRKMNRRYTKERYLELTEKIKKEIPDIALTTDIMVGFPGEGEAEIEDTVDIVKKVRFSGAFTFIYSKRTGTPAAEMEQTEECVVKSNFNKVLEAVNPIIKEINDEKVGKTYSVLAEEVSGGDKELISGRLEDNSLVHFKAPESVIGNIVDVKITDCKTFYLVGEML
ncbi:MAG TPA: tRNA (N6-isopentenyl adenosine(37)-C2)-methylthiotransferase MiaB [Lachnospiraceae bacterium]|nr:tRNA (N6-isopentenyl adenosine(37)-C2)-methylthiotransferase MiaB [Lachnospiraceae bacterium]